MAGARGGPRARLDARAVGAWGRDWARGADGDSVSTLVLRDLGPGGIVLLHDADDYSVPGSWRATAAALPRILDAIAERGLRPVTLQGR